MSQRKPYVGGNWKMNLDQEASGALARGVADACEGTQAAVDICMFPAMPYLLSVSNIILKVRAALEADLEVVRCVGETRDQREKGETDAINAIQIREGLAEVGQRQMERVVIAYEPVWAIGTGKTATPDDAQDAHAKIRSLLSEIYSGDVAERTRVIYGGSMKPSNAAALVGQADVDGGLIGGASLKVEDFAAIVKAAAEG